MDGFIDKIKKQLKLMTNKEKDTWILSQAKILPTWEQEDFYKSICGAKKVINMPEWDDITAFCEKVRDGDISVEYETHYVEFDDYGHFHDDWEYDFYNPEHAMSFISSVIRGCHDLIVLEDYEDAFKILDDIKLCRESSKDNKYVAEKIVNAFEMERFKDCKGTDVVFVSGLTLCLRQKSAG